MERKIPEFEQLSAEKIEILKDFITQILWIEKEILLEFDCKESCSKVSCREFSYDMEMNAETNQLLQKLLILEERIREVEWDYEGEQIKLYPLKPEYDYGTIKVLGEKYIGEAAMNRYFNAFSEAVELYDPTEKRKCGVIIEKIVELNREDFAFFGENIQQKADFMEEYLKLQFKDEEETLHCLFVKQEDVAYGILVCNDFASNEFYSGYLPNLDEFEKLTMEQEFSICL